LYNNYKPAQFGSELRGYKVIHKPRFGKKNLEFDDYQHWYDQRATGTKMESRKLVNNLV